MKKIFALGFFDGVHLGHQALLAECCRIAREQNAEPCAITFRQHPQSLFTDTPPKLINSEQDRMRLMRSYGIDTVRSYPVEKAVMSMPWNAFLDDLIQKGATGFVCGADFRFGNRGEGSAEKLMAYCREKNLLCSIVGDQMLDGIRISSSHIRQLLQAGDIETANRFLGHPHTLTGNVVSGRGIGKTIGVPTANLQIAEDICLPRQGVYACTALVDGRTYVAVTNIGSRPTVGGHHVTVEPWLLDFEGDLYGRELMLLFHRFLREEKKFDSLVQLQEEIQKNALQARKIIEKS